MQSTLDLELHEILARYLAGQTSISEFGKQLAVMAWDIEDQGDLPLINLYHSLELGLAEFDNEDWTELELKEMFQQLLAGDRVNVNTAF